MGRKSLNETNRYLRDAVLKEKLIEISVKSSCAVEGIAVDFNQKSTSIPSRGIKRLEQRYPS